MSTSITQTAPLKGDSDGIFRVVIHGNSGTGKTTLSDSLGQILGVPVHHLDEIHWREALEYLLNVIQDKVSDNDDDEAREV